MERVVARISSGDEVLADRVQARVRVNRPPGESPGWHGFVTLPAGMFIPLGGPYQFLVDDGRSGEIVLTSTELDRQRSTEARFRGTGRFR